MGLFATRHNSAHKLSEYQQPRNHSKSKRFGAGLRRVFCFQGRHDAASVNNTAWSSSAATLTVLAVDGKGEEEKEGDEKEEAASFDQMWREWQQPRYRQALEHAAAFTSVQARGNPDCAGHLASPLSSNPSWPEGSKEALDDEVSN